MPKVVSILLRMPYFAYMDSQSMVPAIKGSTAGR